VSTIHLIVPADIHHVGLVRSTAAHVAAYADLSVDQIADLRLAIDEAYSIVLGQNQNTGEIKISLTRIDAGLEVQLVGPAGVSAPDENSWAWTILSALVNNINVDTSADGTVKISLETRVVTSA
jgi:serine/threonine-protein kinase RsbW